MRLKNADYELLKVVHWELASSGKNDLAAGVQEILTRFEEAQAKTRERNRMNAEENRKAGYAWKSSRRSEHSKYYGGGKSDGNDG